MESTPSPPVGATKKYAVGNRVNDKKITLFLLFPPYNCSQPQLDFKNIIAYRTTNEVVQGRGRVRGEIPPIPRIMESSLSGKYEYYW